jgi:hypothetical protein
VDGASQEREPAIKPLAIALEQGYVLVACGADGNLH